MGYYDCWPFRIIQNSKCSRFNSKYLCPSAEAVKAFSLDWSNEANWLGPPIYLSFKYLKHFALVHLELKGFWCYLVGHQLHSGLSFSTKKQVYKDVFRMYYSGCVIFAEYSVRTRRLWGVFHRLKKLWLAGYGFMFKSEINYSDNSNYYYQTSNSLVTRKYSAVLFILQIW